MLIGLTILCGARLARAERAIVVDIATAAPFNARELTTAIRVRLAAVGAPVRVRVTATGDGVRVEGRGGARVVPLDGMTGAQAARLVALAATNLLLEDLATAPGPLGGEPGPPLTIGLSGAVAAWDGVLGGASIDVAIPHGAWLTALELGVSEVVHGPVQLYAGTLRIAGGLREGWLELRAGVTLAPVIVSVGDGDRTILAGAGVSSRLRMPITARVRTVFAAGVDGFATRTKYESGGMPVTATPWLSPWLAVGVEVSP